METTSVWGTDLSSEEVRVGETPPSWKGALGWMWAEALWILPFWAQELLGYI